MKKLCIFALAAVCLVAAAPASAQVTVEGPGEPAYTNSTQNTQFFRYAQPAGTDAYRLRFMYYADNALVREEFLPVSGTGTTWANWAGVATLQHGSQYGICVQGQYRFPNDSLWISDGPNSCSMGTLEGKRSHTTIDRSKPTTSVTGAGGAEFTKDPSIPLSIAFQDDVAGPFPANFVCVAAGTGPCEGTYGYSAQCSLPANSAKNTTFGCAIDASSHADGPVTICARAADAAVPDNPSSSNQTGQAGEANLSDAACDTVVLDRGGPQLTVAASKTTAQAGEAVAFSAQASDSVSGLDTGSQRWTFSDGSAAVDGGVASRAFEHPGTYVVSFRATDRAGNEATAQQTITVTAKPGGGDVTPPPTSGPVGGGGSLASVRIGSVTVLVPKRVKLGRTKAIALGARADQAGTLTLKLTRAGRTYSKITVRLEPGSSRAKLRLPKRLKAGGYVVRIAFKAAGTSWSAAGKAKVALRK